MCANASDLDDYVASDGQNQKEKFFLTHVKRESNIEVLHISSPWTHWKKIKNKTIEKLDPLSKLVKHVKNPQESIFHNNVKIKETYSNIRIDV